MADAPQFLPPFHSSPSAEETLHADALSSTLEVSDRCRAEVLLERYQLAVRDTRTGIWDWHVETDEWFRSPEWKAILGFTGEHEAEAPFSPGALSHPDDAAAMRELTARLISAPPPPGVPDEYEYEFRLRHRDGSWRWLLSRATIQRGEDGRATRVSGVYTDITMRKEAEAEREAARMEAEAARREAVAAHERMRFALGAAHVIAWEWDLSSLTDPLADFDNAPVVLTPPETDGHSSVGTLFARIHPDDVARVRADIMGAISAAQPTGEAWRCAPLFESEYRLKGSDGVYRWTAARGRAASDPKTGRVMRVLGVRWDIDDRKRAEALLAARADRDRRLANLLQTNLIPRIAPDAVPGFVVDAVCLPALSEEATVGGDFHDVFPLAGGRTALAVGDVMGKGLEAALSIAEVRFALRGFLREDPDPSLALRRLNRFLLEAQRLEGRPRNALVALSLAVVDSTTGVAEIVVAGAETPLLLRRTTNKKVDGSTQIEAIGEGDLLLGAFPEVDYRSQTVQLYSGDLLAFATDGVTEARRSHPAHSNGANGTNGVAKADGPVTPDILFGSIGLAWALRAESVSSPGSDIHGAAWAVADRVRAFAGGKLSDDLCLLLVRRL